MEVYTAAVTVPDLFEATPYGLLPNITWITPADADHWKGGIQYNVDCTFALPTISPCISGAPAEINTKDATWEQITRGARAFTVYDRWDCSAPGGDAWSTGRDRALRALANSAPIQVEQVFWTGLVDNAPARNYPNLSSPGPNYDSTGQILLQPAMTLITGGLDVVEGLDRLEEAFRSCYSGVGWVHVPLGLINAFCARYLVQERNGLLYTWAGNRVILGDGYSTAFGPNGVANPSGIAQIYMTSPVFGIRGTPRAWDPKESFAKGTNTLEFIAEQTFLLGWHCCFVGVEITTGGEESGEPNNSLAAS